MKWFVHSRVKPHWKNSRYRAGEEGFLRIDKQAVLDFATICRQSGVEHFQLLSSVGANAQSRSFYLRSKGELNDALQALKFKRLSMAAITR